MQNILDEIDRKILYKLEEKPRSSAYQVAVNIKQKSPKINSEINQNYSAVKFKINRLKKMGLVNENNEITDLAKMHLPRLREIDKKEEYEILLKIQKKDVIVRIDSNRGAVPIIPPRIRPGTLDLKDLKPFKGAIEPNNLGDF